MKQFAVVYQKQVAIVFALTPVAACNRAFSHPYSSHWGDVVRVEDEPPLASVAVVVCVNTGVVSFCDIVDHG